MKDDIRCLCEDFTLSSAERMEVSILGEAKMPFGDGAMLFSFNDAHQVVSDVELG
jgi:hypothetical protein